MPKQNGQIKAAIPDLVAVNDPIKNIQEKWYFLPFHKFDLGLRMWLGS